MKKTLFYLLALLILVALVAGGLKLRQQRQQELSQVAPPVPAPWAVRTATVQRGRATLGFPALALVKGENEISVAPRLAGVILKMGPREGERVATGDLLARIDTRELKDQLASLEAQRQGALADAQRKQRDTRRSERLLKDHSISESQMDQTRAEARAAREQAHSLENQILAERTRLGYAEIKAPFDGVIAERLADPGDLAAVGKAVYRLIGTDAARLEVRLPAEVLEQVHPGTEVVVSHSHQQITLHANRVFPSLDERSLGRLEIDVPGLPFGAPPGALLRARVITAAVDDALLIAPDAWLPGDALDKGRVLKLTGDHPPRIQTVPATLRLRTPAALAVEAELSPGDSVVVAHQTTLLRLKDGDPVWVEGTQP